VRLKSKNIYKYLNQKYLYILVICFTLLVTFSISNIYYNSLAGADNFKYINNILYIFGSSEEPYDNQGILYYFLVSIFIKIRTENFSYLNDPTFITENPNAMFISENILLANIFIFIFGLIGFYFLMKKLAFNQNKSLLIILIFCYFPSFYYLRFNMKPEILAFAIIPWVFFFFEDFLISKNKMNIFTMGLLTALLISTKGSIAGMVLLCLFVKYLLNYKHFSAKEVILGFGVLLIALGSIIGENYWLGIGNVLQREAEENYDNQASLDFIYQLDFERLRKDPKKNYHRESLIAITVIDLYSDYFELNWKEDSVLFSKKIKPLIVERNLDKNLNLKLLNLERDLKHIVYSGPHPNYLPYQITYLGLFFSFLSFYLVFYYLFKKNTKHKEYIIFPFLGIMVLLINAILGFPQNNFDPNVADTFKVFYYSFLIPFSLLVIINNINFKKINNILLIIAFTIFSFINLGFPKVNDEKFDQFLIQSVENSLFCEVNSTFIEPTLAYENKINCIKFVPSGNISTNFQRIPYVSFLLFSFSSSLIFLKVKNDKK
jgi:hypothetical protein